MVQRPTRARMKMDALLPRVAIGRYVEHRMRFSEQFSMGLRPAHAGMKMS